MALPVNEAVSTADRAQVELLRAAGPARRVALALSLSDTVIALARDAIRRRHPEFTEREVLLRFAEVHYGADLADRIRRFRGPKG